MKLYRREKSRYGGKTTFLGITLFSWDFAPDIERTDRRICNGIVTMVKQRLEGTGRTQRSFYFCGARLLHRYDEGDWHLIKVCSLTVRRQSLAALFLKQLAPQMTRLPQPPDDVYILHTALGEGYLILAYFLAAFIRRRPGRHPLLVTSVGVKQLVVMLGIKIPYICVPDLQVYSREREFAIGAQRFWNLYRPADCSDGAHFFAGIQRYLQVPPARAPTYSIAIPRDTEAAAWAKARGMGVDLDNFVLIQPEANTCALLPPGLWREFARRLTAAGQGTDVVVILGKNRFLARELREFKSLDLSLAEAFALARRARRVIALRSGFTETMLQTGTVLEVIYTGTNHQPGSRGEDTRRFFSLTNIPGVDPDRIIERTAEEFIGHYGLLPPGGRGAGDPRPRLPG